MSKAQFNTTFVNPNNNSKLIISALAAMFAACLYNQIKSEGLAKDNHSADTQE